MRRLVLMDDEQRDELVDAAEALEEAAEVEADIEVGERLRENVAVISDLVAAFEDGVTEYEGRVMVAYMRRVVGNGPVARLKRKFLAAFPAEEADS